MRGSIAFFKKEVRELIRTKRLMIILLTFLLIGILNPATAKLTPKIMELMADEYKSMGITIGEVKITALVSWTQFAKNISTALILAVIIFSGTYTGEYTRGTLIPLLTKGLSRSAVVLSKLMVMILSWSAGLWLCWGVTYFYSEYYWDNSVVSEIAFAGFGWWLFGVLMICCIVFFSSFAGSTIQVMLGTGGVYFAMSLVGIYGKAKKYLPTRLCDSVSLYKGELKVPDYRTAVIITAVASLAMIAAALPLTNRRQL